MTTDAGSAPLGTTSYSSNPHFGAPLTSRPLLVTKLVVMTSASELDAKKAFFKQLDELTGSGLFKSDDDSLGEEEEELRRACRAFFTPTGRQRESRRESAGQALAGDVCQTASQRDDAANPSPNPIQKVIKDTPLPQQGRRRRTEPVPQSSKSIVEETPLLPTLLGSLARSETVPLPPRRALPSSNRNADSPSVRAAGAGAAMKKRKRDERPKLVPQDERLFGGLRFFYIPNDDIAKARKIKIGKAREYGALWTRDAADATHVVVDKALKWRDIEGLLKRAKAAAVVVNEDYPLDCVRYKSLLNPDQFRYHVQGKPARRSSPLPEPDDGPRATGTDQEEEQEQEQKQEQEAPEEVPKAPKARPKATGLARVIPPDSPPSGSQPSPIVIPDTQEGDDSDRENEPKRQKTASPEPSEEIHASKDSWPTRDSFGDELSEYITEMQEFKHLPIDDERDDDMHSVADTEATGLPSDRESGSEEGPSRKAAAAASRSRPKKVINFEDRFACNSGGTIGKKPDNPNGRTIEVLEQMSTYYSRVNDKWRSLSYRKAITTLKRQPEKIVTFEQARALPTIGDSLAAKIEEIVNTDRLQRLEYAQAEPLDVVLGSFLNIYGVGLSQANKWISQGYRTLGELLEKADLTPNQRIGVEHYDDLNTRIPRHEVEAIGDIVRKTARKIDSSVQLLIGGSYRRGAKSSHDVDFIVTKPNTSSTTELAPFLHTLVTALEASNFIVATLAHSRTRQEASKWYGCCVLPLIPGLNGPGPDDAGSPPKEYKPTWRRIDFLLVPESQFGAALIYFTGNDIFNRSIRLLASKKGMRLNQHGLFKAVPKGPRGPRGEKMTSGELVEGRRERKIFEILGVKWRPPEDRWC